MKDKDEFYISSIIGAGTRIKMVFNKDTRRFVLREVDIIIYSVSVKESQKIVGHYEAYSDNTAEEQCLNQFYEEYVRQQNLIYLS